MGLSNDQIREYHHLFTEAIEWYDRQLHDFKTDTSLSEDLKWLLNNPNYSLQARHIHQIKEACTEYSMLNEEKCVEYLRLICRDYKERLKAILGEEDYSGTRFLWIDIDGIKRKIEDFEKMEKKVKWSDEYHGLASDPDFLRR